MYAWCMERSNAGPTKTIGLTKVADISITSTARLQLVKSTLLLNGFNDVNCRPIYQ